MITRPQAGRGDGPHVAPYAVPEGRLADTRVFSHDSACGPVTGDFVTPGQKRVTAPGAVQVGPPYPYGSDRRSTLTARQTG